MEVCPGVNSVACALKDTDAEGEDEDPVPSASFAEVK